MIRVYSVSLVFSVRSFGLEVGLASHSQLVLEILLVKYRKNILTRFGPTNEMLELL